MMLLGEKSQPRATEHCYHSMQEEPEPVVVMPVNGIHQHKTDCFGHQFPIVINLACLPLSPCPSSFRAPLSLSSAEFGLHLGMDSVPVKNIVSECARRRLSSAPTVGEPGAFVRLLGRPAIGSDFK